MMKKTTAILVTACLVGAASSAMAAKRSDRAYGYRAGPPMGWSSYASAPRWPAYGSLRFNPAYNPYENPRNERIRLDPAVGEAGF